MPKFADAVLAKPDTKIFAVVHFDDDQFGDWELEPRESDVLHESDGDNELGLFVIKAIHVRSDRTLADCYMDVVLPERISSSAYFVEGGQVRGVYLHECDGEVIPAVAIDCFGVYELFYSRRAPDVGINVLRRGLTLAKRKRCIAEDLGYIYRDEGRYREAIDAFKITIEEEPAGLSCFFYQEIAQAYDELGDVDSATKYRALGEQQKNQK